MRSSKIGAATNCFLGLAATRSLAKSLTAAGRGAGGIFGIRRSVVAAAIAASVGTGCHRDGTFFHRLAQNGGWRRPARGRRRVATRSGVYSTVMPPTMPFQS
jgi:hypothetical protein